MLRPALLPLRSRSHRTALNHKWLPQVNHNSSGDSKRNQCNKILSNHSSGHSNRSSRLPNNGVNKLRKPHNNPNSSATPSNHNNNNNPSNRGLKAVSNSNPTNSGVTINHHSRANNGATISNPPATNSGEIMAHNKVAGTTVLRAAHRTLNFKAVVVVETGTTVLKVDLAHRVVAAAGMDLKVVDLVRTAHKVVVVADVMASEEAVAVLVASVVVVVLLQISKAVAVVVHNAMATTEMAIDGGKIRMENSVVV